MNAVTGLLVLTLLGAEGAPSKQVATPRERWELTLSEAIRIGLGNAEVVRTVCERVEEDGQVYVTIAPATRVVAPWQFKAETMALVRSIEQLYWTLAQHRAQLAASERAVETARAILNREAAELQGHGTAVTLAEAEQRVGQLSLDRGTKSADVMTTERQLRRVMGLPPADDRQIVPVSPLVETKVKPDWNACLTTMMNAQPDIARQRMMVCASGLQYLVARGPGVLLSNLGLCEEDTILTGDIQQAQTALRNQQAALEQIVHVTTHSLARFFQEIDANHKAFQAASVARAAAAKRVEAQRAFYEEGRIPVDRYLDAVSAQANAEAQEAQYKASYNISLMALEEAKGTLLTYRQVTVEDGPPPVETLVVSSPAPRMIDPEVKQAGADVEPEVETEPPLAPVRNVTFDITIGEARPIRVRGTLSITTDREPTTTRK